MTLEITTPAVLFPTVSLLLLAYTNRFLALTAIVRQMDSSGEVEHEFYQVKNLRKRLNYIKRMQYFKFINVCHFYVIFIFSNGFYWENKFWNKSCVTNNFTAVFTFGNSDFAGGFEDSFKS